MKTVQEWLIELDTTELINAYFSEHPIDFIHMEENAKQMRVCDIQTKGRKKLESYIDYLRNLPIKNNPEEGKGLLFVFRMLYGYSDTGLVHELVLVDELLRDGTEAEAYSYTLTDPAEVMGFYVADTPLTQHNIVFLIANVLFEASFYGWTSEEVNREIEATFSDDEEDDSEMDEEDRLFDEMYRERILNKTSDPTEIENPEEVNLRKKAEKAVSAYFEASRRNELQLIIKQLS